MLGLDAGAAKRSKAGAPGSVLEHRGLADAGLAPNQQRCARAAQCVLEQALDQPLLGIAADQHRPILAPLSRGWRTIAAAPRARDRARRPIAGSRGWTMSGHGYGHRVGLGLQGLTKAGLRLVVQRG